MPKHDQPPSAQAFEAGWLQALAGRYRRLAADALAAGGDDAASVLCRLADEVEAEALGLEVPPATLALPQEEGLDGPAHRLGAHGVWALAVGDRERLFEALSALAGTAEDPTTRQAIEARARAQLGPLARWRLERRRAWRNEAAEGASDDVPEVQSVAELEAFDLAAEERLATELQLLAGCLESERAPALAALLAAFGGASRGPSGAGRKMPSPGSVGGAARTLLEDRFEALITIAERTGDGATQARALELAEIQLNRLRRLLPLLAAPTGAAGQA